MSGSGASKDEDFDWLQALASKLIEDRQNGLPDPARLKELATNAGQRDLIRNLLGAFTPRLLPPERWQEWFDGGPSPREAVTLAQFAPGRNSGKRKVADATGVYEESCQRVAKAKAKVEEVRRTLAAAEIALADAEEAQSRSAAKAQGAVLWLLLREISKRIDVVYAQGPAANLVETLCSGLSLHEAQAVVQKAKELADDPQSELDVKAYLEAESALRVLTALDELHHSPGLEADLRRVILETCQRHAAARKAL